MNDIDEVLSSIKINDLRTVLRLLKENPHLFHVYYPFCWPIMHLCLSKRCVDLDLIKLFVAFGGDVNQKTNSGVSLRFLAAAMPSAEPIQNYLMSFGAEMSVFEEAVILLTNGSDKDDIKGKIIDLLEREPNLIYAVGDQGYTLLHHAVFNFHYSIAMVLIEKGANPNSLTFTGRSLLGICGEPDDQEGMAFYEFLIGKQINYTPLERIEKMIRDGQDEEAVKWFKSNPRMVNGWIPSASGPVLHCAAWLGHSTKIVEYLLRRGVNPDTPNEMGQTALHRVMCRTSGQKSATLTLIRLLAKAGADLNQADEKGYTPLHEAVSHGWDEPAKLLVELGANVNAQTNKGETALDIIRKMRFSGGKSLADWMKLKGAI